MQRLIEVLKEIVSEVREAFAHAGVGDDPVHEVLKRYRARPEVLQEISRLLEENLAAFNYVWFFSQTGLSEEGGFFSELKRRMEDRALPPLPAKNDIFWLLNQLVSTKDKSWLEKITPAQMGRLISFFCENTSQNFSHLSGQMLKAMEILACRISGLGLDPLIASRLYERPELRDNFLKLADLSVADEDSSASDFTEAIKNCERTLLYVRGRRVQEGTSLGLTYRIVYIEELIRRFKIILNVADQMQGSYKFSAVGVMFKQVLVAHFEKIQLRKFLSRNIEILAYQVTLLTGNTGEHYITSTSRELRAMWWKAIKGGMVVAVLVLIKTIASTMHLPPLPQALLYGSIYATGFVVIHLVGGVLATKQPSMTASTLAAALGGGDHPDGEKDLKGLVDVIVRLLRSQLAALFGNYFTAFPIAVLLVFPLLALGIPVASPYKANTMLADLHPFLSLSFLYAAIAGVCLFLSGLLCGLADNWFDFNHISQRLELIFAGARSKKVIHYFRENFGIWTGNISLGFMLGSMSSVGVIVGLPLDIRHVTFASGSFGIGWIHQREMLPWSMFAILAASVFVMGLINLGVSFSLSLFVAMKSRRLKFSQGRTLLWLLLKRLLKSPHELFMTKE